MRNSQNIVIEIMLAKIAKTFKRRQINLLIQKLKCLKYELVLELAIFYFWKWFDIFNIINSKLMVVALPSKNMFFLFISPIEIKPFFVNHVLHVFWSIIIFVDNGTKLIYQ